MSLNRRQQRAYQDTADIYLPTEEVRTDPTTGEALARRYPAGNAPSASGVRCSRRPVFEQAEETGTGRMGAPSYCFHFEAAQVLTDQAYIRLTTPGHPDTGQYYVVQGNPMGVPTRLDVVTPPAFPQSRRRANFREVMAIRIGKPEGFP